MGKELSIYKVMKILEKEYINNHKYVFSLGEKERTTFIQTMKQSCWKFDISVLTYMRLLERDKNRCAICKKARNDIKKGKLCLDHNHELDDLNDCFYDEEYHDLYNYVVKNHGGVFIRGFICPSCNLMLGYAHDNIKVLNGAIRYLKNCSYNNNVLYFPNKKHKLLEQDRQKLYQEQEGKCKICGIKESNLRRELCTDHDHKTGDVRGLLCGSCNSLLGLCHDDINILKQSILYLKRGYDDVIFYHPEITFIRGQLPPVEYMKYAYQCFGEGWEKKFLELD